MDLSFGFAEGIDGWFINGSSNQTVTTEIELSHDQINSALSIKPLTWVGDNWLRQARIALPGTPDLNAAEIELVINVPASYISDNTLALQVIVDGPTPEYGPHITMSELVAGDNTVVVTRTVSAATYLGIQLATAPATTTILDPILVKSVLIKLGGTASSSSSSSSSESSASSSSSSSVDEGITSFDFESDAEGTAYGATGWSPTDLTATVVTISSITAGTGLPTHGDSTKVLKVVANNYNAVPLFSVTLPTGKTLADYKVMVDAYFPVDTVGLTESNGGPDDGDNGYKDLFFLADTTVTGAARPENTAWHSTFKTDGTHADQWKTLELAVDSTKGAALTGSFQIALGINRSASSKANDVYFYDNLRLVAIE